MLAAADRLIPADNLAVRRACLTALHNAELRRIDAMMGPKYQSLCGRVSALWEQIDEIDTALTSVELTGYSTFVANVERHRDRMLVEVEILEAEMDTVADADIVAHHASRPTAGRPRSRPCVHSVARGARRRSPRRPRSSQRRSSAASGDSGTDDPPGPLRPPLTDHAPRRRTLYSFGLLTAAERGAEVEAIS